MATVLWGLFQSQFPGFQDTVGLHRALTSTSSSTADCSTSVNSLTKLLYLVKDLYREVLTLRDPEISCGSFKQTTHIHIKEKSKH